MIAANFLLFISMAYMLVLGVTLTRPRRPATIWYCALLVTGIAWGGSYYIELVSPVFAIKVSARLSRFVFLPWIPLVWLMLLRCMMGIGKRVPQPVLILCAAFNITAAILALTARRHHLFVYDLAVHPVGADGVLSILTYSRGWFHVLLENYLNLSSVAVVVMMALSLRDASPIMRRQLGLLIVAYLVPLVFSTLFIMGLSPVRHVNLAPFMLVFSVASQGWMVLRYGAPDMISVARGILLDSIGDMVFVTDRSGRLVDMNAAALRQTAGSVMTWIGERLDRLPPPWNGMLGSGAGVREACVGDTPCWFDYTCREIRDGSQRTIARLHIVRDITPQHRAEAALRESEEQLRLILDSIAEAVIVHDFQGRIETVNGSMLRMYGLQTVEQARQYRILEELSAAGNELQMARQSWKEILAGQSITLSRWKARRPLAGDTFDVRVVLQLVSVGNAPMVLATVFDISDEIALQKREQAYRKLLEEQRFVDHQQQIIRDLHDGVGGIMAGISMISELGVREPDADKHAAMFMKIANLANEGNVEVRSLMNTLDSREFMWPDLIVEMRRHGTMVEENHGIRFKLAVDGEGDPQGPGLLAGMSLFRIFKEALNNTIKHAAANETVTTLHFETGRFRMVIADNGCGRHKPNASGRGLRNMRERVEALGGDMVLDTENGFRLEFQVPTPVQSPGPGIDRIEKGG